ncbi:PrgI family protein [Caproiciproducens sp.]|uniref:PrgI family protein n=1 Tax=Caproiciproducens sp. TaxID=1954376 RepID=UPI0028979CF3|nr:PrgI family protein [Caproiciproducens sp.]
MAYVPVPKDLTAVKTKVLFNLTKRQLVCFGGGALVGVPLFFLLKGPANLSAGAASFCMVLVMLPFFLMAVYEKDGLSLEKIVRNIARVLFLRPKQRPYQTNNYYAVLARQSKLDKEVHRIVGKKPRTGRRAVVVPRREASDRSRRHKSAVDR